MLIRSYRVRGHLEARLDPLGLQFGFRSEPLAKSLQTVARNRFVRHAGE